MFWLHLIATKCCQLPLNALLFQRECECVYFSNVSFTVRVIINATIDTFVWQYVLNRTNIAFIVPVPGYFDSF